MIDVLKELVNKQIKAAEVKTEPKAKILTRQEDVQTTTLPKLSK